jgi:hypothetical protein
MIIKFRFDFFNLTEGKVVRGISNAYVDEMLYLIKDAFYHNPVKNLTGSKNGPLNISASLAGTFCAMLSKAIFFHIRIDRFLVDQHGLHWVTWRAALPPVSKVGFY